MKVVINACFGGFSLSEKAYEKLIEWGVPVRGYVIEKRGADGLYKPQPLNNGEVIFDRDLDTYDGEYAKLAKATRQLCGRYWDDWIDKNRTHPLLIRLVEELGDSAGGRVSQLKIVEIPDGVDFQIEEYDGFEHVAEKHRTWQ